jgi:hypothetical protein
MATPTLPDEFFSIAELQATAGSPQRARIIAWLISSRVPHVIGLHGWPLVYRDRLLPQHYSEAQNASPTQTFDFSAIHATRRTPALRCQQRPATGNDPARARRINPVLLPAS